MVETKAKKKLLFVIDSLDCAGAEKSLVTLLSLLDYKQYKVDLMLFGYGGILEALLPSEVNLLKPLTYTKFSELPLKKAMRNSLTKKNYKLFTSRLRYSIKLRLKNYTNPQKARIFWESVSKVVENNPETYDNAISYAQGVPTFYVAEKVKAKKKFAWVNVSYRLTGKERSFQQRYYDVYNKIVAVSDSTKNIFLETYPGYKSKMKVIYDINDYTLISNMADMDQNNVEDYYGDGIKLLTIGRLASQKGYDIALEACKKLKDKGTNFKWYVLGKGPQEDEIKEYITKNNLTEHFILLGIKENPYPYIKKSDIYVQTSKFEGFGLAIAEARMLNVPVVTTRFDAVYNQMIDEKNGLVVDMNEEAVVNGIMRLIQEPNLKDKIVQYLKTEKKGNVEELEKFYQLIG